MSSLALASLIEAHAPSRPYCGEQKNRTRIRPLNVGLASPYLQLNSPAHAAWLILDVDRPGAAYSWENAGLPVPTYVSVNRENGHAHIGYGLSSPVCLTPNARNHPIRYLAAIEAAYIKALGSDRGFSGPTAKNPLHERWLNWEPANAPRYELSVLAEYVPELPSRLPRRREALGMGRNCCLFDSLSEWAYPHVRGYWRPCGQQAWFDAVRAKSEELNAFSTPLPYGEVKGIARSVARWVWRNFTPQGFSRRQAAIGSLKGQKKRDLLLPEVLKMKALGDSNKAIARKLDIDPKTVTNWLKR